MISSCGYRSALIRRELITRQDGTWSINQHWSQVRFINRVMENAGKLFGARWLGRENRRPRPELHPTKSGDLRRPRIGAPGSEAGPHRPGNQRSGNLGLPPFVSPRRCEKIIRTTRVKAVRVTVRSPAMSLRAAEKGGVRSAHAVDQLPLGTHACGCRFRSPLWRC
jgi:hypothetical protein